MATDNPGWFTEVTDWMKELPTHHSIERITISWSMTVTSGDTPGGRWHETNQWRQLESQLDRVPALADVRLHLDAVARAYGVGELSRIASEDRANFLRTVWNHPRCSVLSTYVPWSC